MAVLYRSGKGHPLKSLRRTKNVVQDPRRPNFDYPQRVAIGPLGVSAPATNLQWLLRREAASTNPRKKKQNVQTHSEKKNLLNIEIMTMISELKG